MAGERNGNSEQHSITKGPFSIPVGTAGVDLREGAASRSPVALRELLNGMFLHDRAIAKRNGHIAAPMISYDDYPQVDVEEVRPWLYGWGDMTYQGFPAAPVKPPYMPRQTRGGGISVLGDSLVGWTGDRFLVRRDDSERWLDSRGIPAYLPTSVEDRWDLGTSHGEYTDAAVSPTNIAIVYKRSGRLYASVRHRGTGAWILRDLEISASAGSPSVGNGTVVYSNGYFVALWTDGTNLFRSYANDFNPETWVQGTAVANCSGQFDVDVISDSDFIVGWRDGSQIKIGYWHGFSQTSVPASSGTVLTTGGATPNGQVAICKGRDGYIGVAWGHAAGANCGVFTEAGAMLINTVSLSATVPDRLAVAGHWNYDSSSRPQFTAFAEVAPGSVTQVQSRQFTPIGAPVNFPVRYHCYLATRAFRVGDNVMVGLQLSPRAPSSGSVQDFIYLLTQPSTGARASTIGAWCRGETAGVTPATSSHLMGVRPEPGQRYGALDSPSTAKWITTATRTRFFPGLLVDYQPTIISLDFLPPLRAAQFGAALYCAGSVVQAFDGYQCLEAGLLEYPEVTGVTSKNSTGSLTPGAVRSYRVYAVRRNASGEISMSPAESFTAPAVGGGNNTNTVTFTSNMSASGTDVYFEIYGTDTSLSSGSAYYLVASNIPNTASNTISFDDGTPDSTLRNLPTDPRAAQVGAASELLEFALPGCTTLTASGDRLFFSGGSLVPGRVAFTKLREDGEQAGWDQGAGFVDLDATGHEITSLCPFNSSMMAFQRDAIYAVTGDGPDNFGSGSFRPQLVIPGTGALNHQGTGLCEAGLVFWSDSGPRLLTHGFGIEDISQEVEPLARELGSMVTGCVVNGQSREVRWYTSDGRALMWDYSMRGPLGNRWAVWFPLRAAGAVYYPKSRGAVIVQPDGMVLVEDTSAETDGGNHYEFAFWTGDLRPTELLQGDNRFKWLSLTGEYRGPHELGIWTYYDGAPNWDDFCTWDPTTHLSVVEWGSGTGTWDTDPTLWVDPSVQSPDGVYRFRRRLPRDKGALISFRFSDQGAPNNSFIVNEVAVELGMETGLTNTPPRTFGGT